MAKFGKSAGRKLRAGFTAATGGLLAFGTFEGLASLGREALTLDKTLTRIGIQAGGAVNLDKLRAGAARLGKDLGVGRGAMVEVVNEIVNLEGAAGVSVAKMELLGRASVATGANLKDLAGLSFGLNNAFQFDNMAEAEKALSGVIEAGKAGSVPLGKLNVVMQQQAKNFARFGASGAEGAIQLAAFFQVARRGFGSEGEAGTGMKSFFDQIEQNEGKIKGLGAVLRKSGKVGKGEFLDILDIFDELERVGATKHKFFTQAFTSSEARQFLRTVEGERKTRKVDGKKLLGLDDIIAAGKKSNAVQEDSAKFLESRAGRMEKSLTRVKEAFLDLATPENLESFAQAASKVATAIEFIADSIPAMVAGFAAFKALGMARHFGAVAASAAAAAADIVDPTERLAAQGKAGKAGRAQKALGGLGAGLVGFGVGQVIGGAVVGARQEEFARQKAQQEAALTETERASAATLALVEAGLVSEEGTLDPAFARQLRVKQLRGQELSPLEQAGETALAGFEEVRTASSGIASQLGFVRRGGPTRRALVSTEEGVFTATMQAQQDALMQILEELKRRPDTVVEVDGEAIIRATENSQNKKRAPAR